MERRKVIARRDKRVKYEDDNSAWRKSDAGKAAQHARSQSELETRKQFGGRDGTPEEQRIRAIDRQSSRAISQKAYNDARSAHFASVASGVTVEDTGIDLGGPVTPDSLGLPSTPKPAAVEEPAAVAEPNGSGFGPESLGKGPPSARGGSIEGYDPAVQQGIYNNGEIRQNSSTSNMFIKIPEIVSKITKIISDAFSTLTFLQSLPIIKANSIS